jgi:hypothetical protein
MPRSFWLHTLQASLRHLWRPARPRQHGLRLVLEDLEDRTVLSPYVVTTAADSGPSSLRDAITQINADTSLQYAPATPNRPDGTTVDEIDFAITGGPGYDPNTGLATIVLQSQLPPITSPMVIDGYTQGQGTPLAARPNDLSQGDDAILRIRLDGSGLELSAGDSTVEGLVISGNDVGSTRGITAPIRMSGNGNVVQGNYIGPDPTGTTVVDNGDFCGILVESSNNTIGGTAPAARNVIAIEGSNADGQIDLGGFDGPAGTALPAGNNTVQGNYLSTLADGTPLPSPPVGIQAYDGSQGSTFKDNRIVGGVSLSDGNTVQGNTIIDGIVDGGLTIGGSNNLIGGTAPGEGNTIVSSHGWGVGVFPGGGTVGNTIVGNSIFGNAGLGIDLGLAGIPLPNTPGGELTSPNATFSGLAGTVPGSDVIVSGTLTGLPNSHYNVDFLAFYNNIDNNPPSFYDNIAGNPRSRRFDDLGFTTIATDASGIGTVHVDYPNEVRDWMGPLHWAGGIVGYLVSPSHEGANRLQNYPDLIAAQSGSTVLVSGTLNGMANTTYTVDVYANQTADPSGYGQGQYYLGQTIVHTDGAAVSTGSSGNVTFAADFSAASLPGGTLPAGWYLSATATDPGGNTSEFSADIQASASSQAFTQGLTQALQAAINTPSTPAVTMQATPATAAAVAAAIAGVTVPQNTTVTVYLNLAPGTYTPQTVNVPSGMTLYINGSPGTTIDPASPAFTLSSGNVVVANVTFVTTGDAPTILVTGGRLALRNSLIQESTGGNDAAIAITGGTVDLGTATSPGGNTINVNGAGSFLNNGTANPVPVNDDTFAINGSPVAGPSLSFTALASSHLVFTAAPTSTFAGFPLNSPGGVQVAVEDQLGDVETGNTSTVTVAISSGPPGGAFLSGSTTSARAQNGVATFPNLAINLAGTYTLKASDGSLTSATATVVIQPNAGILLLDPTGQSLTVSGNASLNVTNYGAIVTDSSNSAAVSASANASITATEIDVHGGLSASSLTAIHGVTNQGAAALADPLANLAAPSQPSTQFTAVNYSGTLQPGTYVGGITVSGSNSVTLQPGLYYLKGGGLTASGSASVTGTGVMLYLTGINSTSVNISGNASVTLTPPTSGPYQGVVLFQDRTSNAAITISGKGALNTTGTEYAPGATVTLSGTSDTDDPTHTSLGAEWIVDDLVLSGNAQFTISANANNRSQNPNAFLVAGGPVQSAAPVAALTPAEAEAALKAALALWSAAGLDAGTLQALSRATVTIAPLPGPYLGLAAPGAIYLDPTAEGYGWFTDVAATATPPADRIDLLTVVTHELGHLFGLMDGNGTALMASTLAAGVRILPDASDLLASHLNLAISPATTGRTAASNSPAGPVPASARETHAATLDPVETVPTPLTVAGSDGEGREMTPAVVPTDAPVDSRPLALPHDGISARSLVASGENSAVAAGAGNVLLLGGQGRNGLIGALVAQPVADYPLHSIPAASAIDARKLDGGPDAAAVDAVFQARPLGNAGLVNDGAPAPLGMEDILPDMAPALRVVDSTRMGAARSLTLSDLAAAGAMVFGLLGANGAVRDEEPESRKPKLPRLG